jgi:hypothetical protein
MSDFILSAIMRAALPRAALAGTVLAGGCGLSVLHGLTGDADAGSDAGMHPHPGMDAGTDAGTDAGHEKDAGHSPDTGMGMMDAGTIDAGRVDAGADAGTCVPVVPTTYKRVFLTSQPLSGPLVSLESMDDHCQLLALNQCLGGTWKVWLSDSTRGPSARFNHVSVPYQRLDTMKVADDWSDLIDGSINVPISVTELGTTVTNAYVWTATNTAGNPFNTLTCSDWQSSSASAYAKTGNSGSAAMEWTHQGDRPCASPARLYCFEQ